MHTMRERSLGASILDFRRSRLESHVFVKNDTFCYLVAQLPADSLLSPF